MLPSRPDAQQNALAPRAAVRYHPGASISPKPDRENTMAWTTPRVVEICVGMEVTSYESAE
jgi:coenzyme PQQ precursor peptide PqqA